MAQEIGIARLLLTKGNTVFTIAIWSHNWRYLIHSELQGKVLQPEFNISYIKEYLSRKYGNVNQ